ncbi:hypothetical protein ACJRO7_005326 [Eucalyptus globulus]|uniref:Kinesin-like protein n=1 Tax=Eucalyptus globulus TaxID=34317 RepID=A0ABD3J5C1_EUCGL
MNVFLQQCTAQMTQIMTTMLVTEETAEKPLSVQFHYDKQTCNTHMREIFYLGLSKNISRRCHRKHKFGRRHVAVAEEPREEELKEEDPNEEPQEEPHPVLQTLIIESSAREFLRNNNLSTLAATVNFVDLAGSECASQSLSAGARLKEGCHINRRLPNSKPTRILESSLGENARTSIICRMSTAQSHVEQSRSTLLFASCAKEVATNTQFNVVISDKALVKHLQRELARLGSELRNPGLTSVSSDSAVLLREKDPQTEKYVDVGIRTFDSCQYLDRHSRSDSDGHIIHIPDFELSIHLSHSRRNSICPEDNGDYTDENSEDFCRENCRGNGDVSSVEEKEGISDYIVVEEGDKEREQLDSVPQDYVETSLEKAYSMILASSIFHFLIEEMEINHRTPPLRDEKECPGRPEGCQRKFPSLNGSQNSQEDSLDNELQADKIQTTEICDSSMPSASEIEESIAQREDQPGQHGVHDIKHNVIAPTKHVKDVDLDPTEDYAEGSLEWFSHLKKLQKEIVRRWKENEVSFVHKSHFFLLFKGDPTDSICVDVELRRFLFLRDKSAHRNQALEDAWDFIVLNSIQFLGRERQMLTKQLHKKLTGKDREMLFQTWRISLNTKHRSLQLAHRLSSDTEDMDHVAKSTNIKLVGFVQPEQASKEMFGLNYNPPRSSTKINK